MVSPRLLDHLTAMSSMLDCWRRDALELGRAERRPGSRPLRRSRSPKASCRSSPHASAVGLQRRAEPASHFGEPFSREIAH
eukprot:84440-Prymnesium_polylepis.1